jgi:hypothetical protein
MIEVPLLFLGVLALSLTIAGLLMARSRTLLGIILGALPIALSVFIIRRSIQADINKCMVEACVSAGLPAGCTVGEFGCHEWTGLGLALTSVFGVIDLVLYVLGLIVIALVLSRRR